MRRDRDGAVERRVVEGRLAAGAGALPLPERVVPKERPLLDSFVFLTGGGAYDFVESAPSLRFFAGGASDRDLRPVTGFTFSLSGAETPPQVACDGEDGRSTLSSSESELTLEVGDDGVSSRKTMNALKGAVDIYAVC